MSPKKKKGKQVVMEPEFSDTPEKDPPPDQSRERVSAYDSMEVGDDLERLDQTNQEMRIKAMEVQLALLNQRAIEADLKEASLREQTLELEKKEERLKERQMKIEASLIERMSALEQKENESDLKRSLETDVMSLVLQMQSEEVVVAQERLLAQQTAETERMRREAEVMEASLKQLEARENELSLGVVKTKVDGFDDAKEAGGENAEYCTLILTEGLSAASFVRKALDVFPEDKRRRFGVFALQGKVPNVKKASKQKMEENKLLKRLKIAMERNGQQRYGRVMIMTDQDVDGFHIKGLLINLFHTVWPDLVKRKKAPFFIGEFVTPMYKATNELNEVLSFYSKVEYHQWYDQGNRAGWEIKRYKGIASGTDEDAEEYFRNFDNNYRNFVWKDEDEATIHAAFSRKKVGERKDWIDKYVSTSYLDRRNKETTEYSDFLNQELILFALESVKRSIPMMVDGLITSQRKTLFCALGGKPNKEYKVTDLAGRVSHKSDYRHGQRSIVKVIIKMARDYVGESNINLLNRIGQFGTRRFDGQDAATATYISTKLSPLARFIFPEDDDIVLDYEKDHNGKTIEPKWYMPIIPLILVNGCNGIGYPFSTFIPNFNTKTIIKNIRLKLDEKSKLEAMEPSYIGFQGKIKYVKEGVYSTTGVYEKVNDTTIKISELPINPIPKVNLESLKKTKEGGKLLVLDVEDKSTSSQFDYRVTMTTDIMEIADINKTFRLESTIRYSNMVLLHKDYKTKRYKTPQEIFDAFFEARSQAYQRRQVLKWDMMRKKLHKLKQMDRYVSLLKERKVSTGMSKSDWEAVLKKEGLVQIEDANGILGYNYLFQDTSGWTEENCNELKDKISTLERDVEEYRQKDHKDLWREDLDRLEEAMEKLEKLDEPENPRKRKELVRD